MSKISPHFSRHEFACHCGCGFDTVDSELLRLLEEIRTHFNDVVHVNSCSRCVAHNATVGGAESSQHLVSKAADINVFGVASEAVADYIDERYPSRYGLGRYSAFTHVDVRQEHARWGE